MRFIVGLVAATMVLGFGSGVAHADRRVALVIGNNTYTNLPDDQQLKTAVNDARAVANTLGQLGFEVITGENLSRSAFSARFDELTRKLSPGDTALFYFAGHGVSLGGGNYLLPSDVPDVDGGQEGLLARSSLNEDDLVTEMQSHGVRIVVVMLDACRNNPFKRSSRGLVGGERGFTRIEPSRPSSGVFKLYSAGIGQSALDQLNRSDTNPNSVFTRVLVPELAKPGLDLATLAKRVGKEVQRLALTVDHEQQPAYYDQVLDAVYLSAAPSGEHAAAQSTGGAPASSDAAKDAWMAAKDTTSIAVLEEFVRRYGDSFYASLARARIDELKKTQAAAVLPAVVRAPTVRACGSGADTVSLSSPSMACPLSAAEERSFSPKDMFKECTRGCPEMVVVPSGAFLMGSPGSEAKRNSDEDPQHPVTIAHAFAVGRFAVTFDEWDACVADGGCGGNKPEDDGWGRGRRPAIYVSWDDAKAYLQWLSKKTGHEYRLLSEAEWEYVARAGTSTPFWWGSTITVGQANYDGSNIYNGGAKGASPGKTLPVGSFGANPFGLSEVHGNVWEWVEDCYNKSYVGAPSDGSAWRTGDCDSRVLRGGAWNSNPRMLRASFRYWNSSMFRFNYVGFRVARTLIP